VTAPDELNGRCCDPDLAPGELFWKSAGKCGCTGGNAVAAGCFKSAPLLYRDLGNCNLY
jgi:hypothetical protein